MTEAQDESSSRKALLKDQESSQRDSSDEEEEVDALIGPGGASDSNGPIVRAYDKKTTRSWTIRRPSRSCLIIIGILLIGLIGVIAGSSYFFYKIKPPDGQSPPCMMPFQLP